MKERCGPNMAYRMYVSIVLLGGLACRASEGRDIADTAKAPEPGSGQARTAAPTRGSSGRTVALTTAAGDTTSVRRDSATAPLVARKRPPHPAPTPLPANDTTPTTRPDSPASADSTQQQQQAVDKLAVNQSEYNGWKTFAVNCTRCHGEDGVGSTIAPNLMKALREHVDHEVFVTTVKNGRPDKGMPTWGPLLTDKQVEDLYAYLKARSEGRLAPGRPHVKPEG